VPEIKRLHTPLFKPVPQAILRVSQLTKALRTEIEHSFSDIWIEGEVANLRIPQSGHYYFTLKDETAQIKAVRFRAYGGFVKFIPKEGELVLIRGHLTVYEARGEYQIVVDYIEPRGIGALMAAFEALKERLRIEGLFDDRYKKPIPALPRKIALVTSRTGAVLHDFLKILRERKTPVTTWVVPVTVQGEGAAGEIAQAISAINDHGDTSEIDLIVLARGGGSLEDLWAFNEEVVARAIFQSTIPVISAIGHETDTTMSDFVSDLRAPTPSVAAEIIARNYEKQVERFCWVKAALHQTMEEMLGRHRQDLTVAIRLLMAPEKALAHFAQMTAQYFLRLRAALERQLTLHQNRQALTTQRLHSQNPIEQIARFRQEWGLFYHRLCRAGETMMDGHKKSVMIAAGQLNVLSPLHILGRGYSITQQYPSRNIVRDMDQVAPDEMVQIRLHRGKLLCLVKEKEL
jgi:exodeoxyribonuclease VII large subunit